MQNYRHWARRSQPLSAAGAHWSNDQAPVRDLEWGGSEDARGSERSLPRHGASDRSMRSGVSEESADASSRVACASATSTPEARTTGGVLIVVGSPSTSITETAVRPAMRRRIHAAHKIWTTPTTRPQTALRMRSRRPAHRFIATSVAAPRQSSNASAASERPRWRTFVTTCRNT